MPNEDMYTYGRWGKQLYKQKDSDFSTTQKWHAVTDNL